MFKVLDAMNRDGGIIVGFNVFIPFEDKEIETFLSLCDRREVVEAAVWRADRLRPCPQLLSWSDRGRDSRALENIQNAAYEAERVLKDDILDFRKKVLDRFQASR